jgi:hypothetical protein
MAIQINCKTGGAPWTVDIPLQVSFYSWKIKISCYCINHGWWLVATDDRILIILASAYLESASGVHIVFNFIFLRYHPSSFIYRDDIHKSPKCNRYHSCNFQEDPHFDF